MGERGGQVTQMLLAISDGDRPAEDGLFPLVYDELRAMAQDQMARERGNHTLQPTALVHEAYLRLVGNQISQWPSRRYFFAAAATAMRRILVEHARGRYRHKRGGHCRPQPLEGVDVAAQNDTIDWLALDEAIEALQQEDQRLAEVVHLRFFAGMNVEETAQELEVSPRTVKRDWRYAKAFLLEQMTDETAAQREAPTDEQ